MHVFGLGEDVLKYPEREQACRVLTTTSPNNPETNQEVTKFHRNRVSSHLIKAISKMASKRVTCPFKKNFFCPIFGKRISLEIQAGDSWRMDR